MTAQDFLKIWFYTIGFSGFLFFLFLFGIGSVSIFCGPLLINELDGDSKNNESFIFILYQSIIYIVLNYILLLPLLVVVTNVINRFDNEIAKTNKQFIRVKNYFRMTLMVSFMLTYLFFEWQLLNWLFFFTMITVYTLIGELLLFNFSRKYFAQKLIQ